MQLTRITRRCMHEAAPARCSPEPTVAPMRWCAQLETLKAQAAELQRDLVLGPAAPHERVSYY